MEEKSTRSRALRNTTHLRQGLIKVNRNEQVAYQNKSLIYNCFWRLQIGQTQPRFKRKQAYTCEIWLSYTPVVDNSGHRGCNTLFEWVISDVLKDSIVFIFNNEKRSCHIKAYDPSKRRKTLTQRQRTATSSPWNIKVKNQNLESENERNGCKLKAKQYKF